MTRIPFPDPLTTTLQPNGGTPRRVLRLEAGFRYFRPNGQLAVAEPGLEWDGASIPSFFYRVIGPPIGPYAESSVIHDAQWLFARRKAQEWSREGRRNWQAKAAELYSHANLVFNEALTDQFTALVAQARRCKWLYAAWLRVKRWAMIRAVRIGARRELRQIAQGKSWA